MTATGISRMGFVPHDRLRERLGRFLADHYRGPLAVARLSNDLACSRKTAENLLLAHWPNDLTFAAILRRFGKDVWSSVFAPEIEPVLAKLEAEERRLERELEAKRAQRRQVAGADAQHPDLFAALEAETPG